MRYVALAVGFDGTLARDGVCDERCIEALRALAATGRKLILVTGRELRELLEIFPEARLFDYVVAENGAVMHRPATRESEILAQAPPEILLQELRRRHVTPLSVGSSMVRTVQANEAEVSAALSKLQLDFQLVTNPGALMMLPAGVNKASGVWAALRELGVSRHNLVAIGDGENDLALFEFAEHAVAVQNADTLVKRVANRTTHGAYCDGFLELARDLVADDLAGATPRHKFAIGVRENGAAVEITPCQDSLLVHGPDGTGKSALCSRLLEQFLANSYQCCVIDAEVGGMKVPGEVEVFGDAHEVPRLTDILSALDQPTASVAINLAALARRDAPSVHRCAARAAAGAARSPWQAARRADPSCGFLPRGRRDGVFGAVVGSDDDLRDCAARAAACADSRQRHGDAEQRDSGSDCRRIGSAHLRAGGRLSRRRVASGIGRSPTASGY